MTGSVTDDPTSYNFPQVKALGAGDIDRLGRALLSLTREICVLTDRQAVLEKLLEDAGVLAADRIEHYAPDEAVQARIDKRMAAIVQSIMSELVGD